MWDGQLAAAVQETGYTDIEIVKNADGSYRLMQLSPDGNTWYALQAINGSVDSTADAVWAPYTGANYQKWVLERGSQIGGAVPYRQINSIDIRCYPYAFLIDEELYVPEFSPYDTVQTAAQKVITHMQQLGRRVRIVEQNALILPSEYKVAMKIGKEHNIFGNLIWLDYHFMLQPDTGGWAHKQGQTASVNLGNINPSTYTWAGTYEYQEGPIYFAVSLPQ